MNLPVEICSTFSFGSFALRAAALGSILGKNIIILEKTIQVIPIGVQPAKKKTILHHGV